MSSGRVSSPGGRRTVKRRPPGWRQWVLALGGAAILMVALIVFVNHEDATSGEPAPVNRPAAIAEQNREARILVGQDQAPHLVRLRSHAAAGRALQAAVVAYMKRQIGSGAIEGPVTRSGCTPATSAAGTSPTRLAFGCQVEAGNVRYPFLGVVDTTAHQITYCKRDAPPVPSMNIPVSTRCT